MLLVVPEPLRWGGASPSLAHAKVLAVSGLPCHTLSRAGDDKDISKFLKQKAAQLKDQKEKLAAAKAAAKASAKRGSRGSGGAKGRGRGGRRGAAPDGTKEDIRLALLSS